MRIALYQLRALPVLAEQYKNERIGGEEVQHALLAKALVAAGHEVRLIVGDFGQEDGAKFEGVTTLKTYAENEGLPVVRFLYPRLWRFWQALKRANPDVVYVSCAGMEVGIAALFCKKYAKRLVFRAASDADCDPAKLLIRYQRDKWLYHYGVRHADAILVQTSYQQNLLQANFNRPSTVAAMLVEQAATLRPVADIAVLWVANLRHVKRPDRVLELAKLLPDITFHMAGGTYPAEPGLFDQIKRQAASLPNLVFHGPIAYRDIGKLFDRCKIFINTSELEGFPNTFLQSWIRGIPVLATFDPDQIIAKSKLGVACSSVAGMRQAIVDLAANPVQYQDYSNNARAYMQRNFSTATILAPYLEAMKI
jgi:glycosyltransferase involved in cell wall biosynthesis